MLGQQASSQWGPHSHFQARSPHLHPQGTLGNILGSPPCSPALMAASHQVFLLYSVRQELGPAEGQPDIGQQLGQAGPSLLSVVSDPGQRGFKDLPRQSGCSIAAPRPEALPPCTGAVPGPLHRSDLSPEATVFSLPPHGVPSRNASLGDHDGPGFPMTP